MKIEIHLLQNIAPSCLNRDDTNTPKSCEFGGVSRARVSSQSWKRATRTSDMFRDALKRKAVRTRDLAGEIAKQVAGSDASNSIKATTVKHVITVFKDGGLIKASEKALKAGNDSESDPTESSISKVLVYLDESGFDLMVEMFRTSWDSLIKGDKDIKSKLIEELANQLVESAKTPEIALFGRMLEVDSKTPFGKKQFKVDAACQVAHALSTHAVNLETDFYTAVDDLSEEREETGAGMLGTQGFNSACFYRYALIDTDQLTKNLGGDTALAVQTVEAFLRAFTLSIPGAKQNSHAAQNPPSFGLFVARETGIPVSLANAFARPISGADLISESIANLARYHGKMQKVYGLYDGATQAVFHDRENDKALGELKPNYEGSLGEAIETILKRVRGEAA
jgi:CRISPR system Cascade subunit CasC